MYGSVNKRVKLHKILLMPPHVVQCVSLIASPVLEGMLEVISEHRALHRKHLHILLQEQIQNLNLSFGMGDSYHGFEFMKERCKVTDIKAVITYRIMRKFIPIIILNQLRFQVLTAASMTITVTWDVGPCSLAEVYRRFRGACCLHHQDDDSVGNLLPDYTAQHPRRQSSTILNQAKLQSIMVLCWYAVHVLYIRHKN
jgi:hypothetical protein